MAGAVNVREVPPQVEDGVELSAAFGAAEHGRGAPRDLDVAAAPGVVVGHPGVFMPSLDALELGPVDGFAFPAGGPNIGLDNGVLVGFGGALRVKGGGFGGLGDGR